MRTFALLVSLAAASVSAATVMESSYALPDGRRVIRHDVLVAATPEAVWEALMKDPQGERLSFVPNDMLSWRNERGVFTVIQLIRIADPGTTRIRMSTLPFGSEDEWNELYERLRRANADFLQRVERRFAH